jgi:hypothetical protein
VYFSRQLTKILGIAYDQASTIVSNFIQNYVAVLFLRPCLDKMPFFAECLEIVHEKQEKNHAVQFKTGRCRLWYGAGHLSMKP